MELGKQTPENSIGAERSPDLIAHGKAEKLQGEVIHPAGTDAHYPVSELRGVGAEKQTLSLVLSDVEEFLNSIQIAAIPLLKTPDIWFGDEALQGPPWYMGHSTTLNE